MYRVQFLMDEHLVSQKYRAELPPYIEAVGSCNTADLLCESISVCGNKVYCEIGDGFIFTIPSGDFIQFHHVEGTPERPDTETGGFLYHQYRHDTKTPTGLATYNPDYLCIWLMDGYDVVIESSDNIGNISNHYITRNELK